VIPAAVREYQGYCVPVSSVRGRRSLMVASTSVRRVRDNVFPGFALADSFLPRAPACLSLCSRKGAAAYRRSRTDGSHDPSMPLER
jgi:hypothetical protein